MFPGVDDTSQRRYWEKRMPGRLPDHPVVRFFVRQRIEALQKFLDFSKTETLLDIGSGDGWSLLPFQELVPCVVGADRSFRFLKKSGAHFSRMVQCDIYRLPFPDRSFDIVSCWEVLHHVGEIETAVREMVRVSRRTVAIFEPNRYHPLQFLFGLAVKEERGTLRSTTALLTSLLKKMGAEILYAAHAGAIFPNKLPPFFLPIFRKIPFHHRWGISCMVVAKVPETRG